MGGRLFLFLSLCVSACGGKCRVVLCTRPKPKGAKLDALLLLLPMGDGDPDLQRFCAKYLGRVRVRVVDASLK